MPLVLSINKVRGPYNKVILDFDDGSSRKFIKDIIDINGIVENTFIDEGSLDSLKYQSDVYEGERFSISLISRRLHSEWEIRNKLKKKGFTHIVVKEIVNKIKKSGYLDDLLFARLWIESRLRRYSEARFKITAGLLSRGVARDTALQAVDQTYPREKEFQTALQFSEKLILKSSLSGYVLYKKLKSKGFSQNIINRVSEKLGIEIVYS